MLHGAPGNETLQPLPNPQFLLPQCQGKGRRKAITGPWEEKWRLGVQPKEIGGQGGKIVGQRRELMERRDRNKGAKEALDNRQCCGQKGVRDKGLKEQYKGKQGGGIKLNQVESKG